jgi:hypothetical protein
VIMLAAYGALLGAILGVRYRVFVLVPTILAGAALVGAVAMVQGASPLRAAEAMVVLGVLLQVGYICSSLIRHAVVPPDWATRPSLLVASSSGRRKPRATP